MIKTNWFLDKWRNRKHLKNWLLSFLKTKDPMLVVKVTISNGDKVIDWHVFSLGHPQKLKIGEFKIEAELILDN